MTSTELVGLASATIGSISVLPQIIKSWQTRSSKDISTQTILLTYVSTGLAIVYGFLIRHVAVYVGNAVILVLYLVLHAVKVRNARESVPVLELAEV